MGSLLDTKGEGAREGPKELEGGKPDSKGRRRKCLSCFLGQVCVWQWTGAGTHLPHRLSRGRPSLEMDLGGKRSFAESQVLPSLRYRNIARLGEKCSEASCQKKPGLLARLDLGVKFAPFPQSTLRLPPCCAPHPCRFSELILLGFPEMAGAAW